MDRKEARLKALEIVCKCNASISAFEAKIGQESDQWMYGLYCILCKMIIEVKELAEVVASLAEEGE